MDKHEKVFVEKYPDCRVLKLQWNFNEDMFSQELLGILRDTNGKIVVAGARRYEGDGDSPWIVWEIWRES